MVPDLGGGMLSDLKNDRGFLLLGKQSDDRQTFGRSAGSVWMDEEESDHMELQNRKANEGGISE